MKIRIARQYDLQAIDRLMEPEINAGHLLPRTEDSSQFLVAERSGTLIGAVALRPLTDSVAELCSLVARHKGQGIGRRLVDALVLWAEQLGYEEVVALTEATRFFEHCDFTQLAIAPWQLSPHRERSRITRMIVEANQVKARTCGTCTRRPTCRQKFLNRSLQRQAA